GTVHLASADPEAARVIDPAYLSAEADRRVMRDGVRLAERIGAASPLRDWQAGRLSPGAPLETDEAIDAWVRASANTIFHPVGSCRMGADDAAVVDAELKVRGVEGLRVADASVMPRIVGGNTSAPTMMIGEKAADLALGRAPPPAEDPAEAAA
ncbi:MAG: GMC oxidoreductase, partial [Paracoccaceae bacterium]